MTLLMPNLIDNGTAQRAEHRQLLPAAGAAAVAGMPLPAA
jgi:hypothetical protein